MKYLVGKTIFFLLLNLNKSFSVDFTNQIKSFHGVFFCYWM